MKWVFSKFPVYFDASPPRPTLRSPELQPSHSAHLRPLRRVLGQEFPRSRLGPSRKSSSIWGSGLYKRLWVKCCGLPRLSVDGSIQTKRSRILVSYEGVTEGGACAVDPGVQQDCWSQGGWSPSAGAHRTGWCELKDLQAACSPDRRWGSTSTEQSGRLSTVLRMVLIGIITMSQQLQRGEKVQWRNDGKYPIIWGLKAVWKLIVTDIIPLC